MLTPRQAALLRFIDEYQRTHGGVSPTYSEMRVALGLASKSGVNRMVVSLTKRGFIRRRPGYPRAIDVINMPKWGAQALHDSIASVIARMIEQGERPRVLVISNENLRALTVGMPLMVSRAEYGEAEYNGLSVASYPWTRDWEVLP